jgi:hypothetical protein
MRGRVGEVLARRTGALATVLGQPGPRAGDPPDAIQALASPEFGLFAGLSSLSTAAPSLQLSAQFRLDSGRGGLGPKNSLTTGIRTAHDVFAHLRPGTSVVAGQVIMGAMPSKPSFGESSASRSRTRASTG